MRGPSLAVPGVLPGSWLLPDCAHVLGPRRVPPRCVTHPPTKCSGLWAESVRGLTVSSACRLDSGKERRCSFSLALHPWNVVVKASASDRGGGTSSPGLPGHSANPRGFGDSSLPSPRSGDHRSEISRVASFRVLRGSLLQASLLACGGLCVPCLVGGIQPVFTASPQRVPVSASSPPLLRRLSYQPRASLTPHLNVTFCKDPISRSDHTCMSWTPRRLWGTRADHELIGKSHVNKVLSRKCS